MKTFAIILLVLALAGCVSQGQRGRGPVLKRVANPSEILALDIAQNREAQTIGILQALKDTAAKDAVTFVPEPVNAKEWLSSASPVLNTSWQPHSVLVSCDGTMGVTTGAIRWGSVDGYYTTVWRDNGKLGRKRDWQWVLSHGDGVETPRQAAEFLQTSVASCEGEPSDGGIDLGASQQTGQMQSNDRTLIVSWTFSDDRSRKIAARLWEGSAFETKLLDQVKVSQ